MALILRHLGVQPYAPCLAAMQRAVDLRPATAPDEIWLLQHPPVYTLGLAARPGHLHEPLHGGGYPAIPVVRSDRGGQITYHGPGQWIAYCLIHLARRGFGVRSLVVALEEAAIRFLAGLGIAGSRRPGAPGVYVDGAKIAALGLRVRRGWSYHGLALNVDLDLAPYRGIDPCGYPGLAVTRVCDLAGPVRPDWAGQLLAALQAELRLDGEPVEYLDRLPGEEPTGH